MSNNEKTPLTDEEAPFEVRVDQTLVRMAEVVENEMLHHMIYASSYVVRSDLREKGSVCQGHEACVVGSLWFGYGAYEMDEVNPNFLVGIVGGLEREQFLAQNPVLSRAYDALNASALEYIEKHEMDREAVEYEAECNAGLYFSENGWLEILFESRALEGEGINPAQENRAMFEIIERARELAPTL